MPGQGHGPYIYKRFPALRRRHGFSVRAGLASALLGVLQMAFAVVGTAVTGPYASTTSLGLVLSHGHWFVV
ncbi:hypothetical protein [Komagataeibacter europaeus]|uniref:hypothetical protein n=1 Tax=Komagataeibacter europaeus TaxID=33995 RepID=UPI00036BEACF|nr:hypothetical protein [Komagataeibacter europaeus]